MGSYNITSENQFKVLNDLLPLCVSPPLQTLTDCLVVYMCTAYRRPGESNTHQPRPALHGNVFTACTINKCSGQMENHFC